MDRFSLRRAIERLRDGLFDSTVVNSLTIEKDRIENVFRTGLKLLEKGKSDPLCICGSYGQGKSHTLTYLNQLALSQGFAASMISLDLREVPFYQFSTVYRQAMERLTLPDGLQFTNAWKNWAGHHSLQILENIPHRFKMILTAMLCKNKKLPSKEGSLKKKEACQPKEFGNLLEKALIGYEIPAAHIKKICKYRKIEGYKEHSLTCRGNEPYFQMLQSLGRILHEMGYKGLLLFFDEAESITEGRLHHRIKSYRIFDQFFENQSFLFPVFALTDNFFDKVNHESYNDEKGIFPKNYSEVWRYLNIVRLSDFSSGGWDSLLDRLMELYSQAYEVKLTSQVKPNLLSLVTQMETQETRFKLKALVNKLDIESQKLLLDA